MTQTSPQDEASNVCLKASLGATAVLLGIVLMMQGGNHDRGPLAQLAPSAPSPLRLGPQFGMRSEQSVRAQAEQAKTEIPRHGRLRRPTRHPSDLTNLYDKVESKTIQEASSDPTSMFDMSTP
uniref:Uncharacterized protein n=1 Tax=Haptolina brevifila TaxID=156173 RepID=A0A7S2I9C7_9EUKA|mmetsp:Transcript_62847/g.124084  ORF Transcript_62847/g.124084 Transcript_62847/m.124084 type:complete len:123 (+) Transcript_62847:156-524(+)|eukprot:CAMPEP_0174719038 /NCGR_PEP_ID=MMETSP1094-20130205/30702_1 /TAXON_ID=156173 /ORGANISM="Chrysochromulina brevifilum, Strain UTEX LB 985" /LENGTH=122 /DNA_ID=CAMNT_0015919291 /DNA_START=153 /DNA_END=521 /DNA_ORIENTATION=-